MDKLLESINSDSNRLSEEDFEFIPQGSPTPTKGNDSAETSMVFSPDLDDSVEIVIKPKNRIPTDSSSTTTISVLEEKEEESNNNSFVDQDISMNSDTIGTFESEDRNNDQDNNNTSGFQTQDDDLSLSKKEEETGEEGIHQSNADDQQRYETLRFHRLCIYK